MSTPKRILVVDDDEGVAWSLRKFLEDEGYGVAVASSAEEALDLVAKEDNFSLVLLDVRLPGMDGLDALGALSEKLPDARVVVMTAHGTVETAVEAVRRGAFEYLTKPLSLEALGGVVARALAPGRGAPEVERLKREVEPGELLAGRSAAMQEVFKRIAAVAASDAALLVTGDSGTGKELCARAVHFYSARAEGPFVPVNCAGIPETLLESELFGHARGAFTGAVREVPGRVEAAAGGTLFLDEVAEMPASMQAKLLRFIESKRFERVGEARTRSVDVRIFGATNQDLRARVAGGVFREDLYYRLAVLEIEMPPLREREGDLALLAAHFLGERKIGTGAMRCLQRYDWPGNVRELRNALEHAAALARLSVIEPEHLPEHVRRGRGGTDDAIESLVASLAAARLAEIKPSGEGAIHAELLARVERAVLREVLRATNGNQVRAARFLGIHRTTLRKKIEEYGL